MTLVELRDIEKHYGDITAVDGVSLEIEDGEFVSILGPSGSGKTTTLRILAGFESPDVGEVLVDGEDITDDPPEDRDMSMIFQSLALFPHMTVADNVSFGLEMQTDLSDSEISTRVADVLEMVELDGYQERMIQDLSGGEQQRVALARAIVTEPAMLLYDEPLSDLDRQLRENMRREIADLHDQLAITSLYVTHNQREALTLADRIAVMQDGKIVRIGTPAEVYADPQSEFVAQFVGDSNFLSGTVRRGNGTIQFEDGDLSLPLDEQAAGNRTSVTLYMRPEHLRLGDDSEGPATTECEITSAVHLGSVTEYTIEVNGDEMLVTSLGAPEYEVGDRTTVTFEEYNVLPG